MLLGDDHTCYMEEIGSVFIKMFDEMVRKLKDVRYISQLKKNLISIGALKVQGFKVTLEDGVLKILKDSMVILKCVKQNILYYLKDGTVTEQVTASEGVDDSTRPWHMRLGRTGEKSMQALAKQRLLKGAKTCKLEFCEHCIIDKKTKVKFGTAIPCTEGILDYIHINVWGPTKTASLGRNHYFVSFIDDYSRHS